VFLIAMLLGIAAIAVQASTQRHARSRQTSTNSLSPADKSFVTKAVKGNLAEIKLAQLAQEKSANSDVKSFAKKMISDHQKMNTDMESLATRNGMTLSTTLEPKEQALYDRLSKLTGPAFDHAYINEMVKDHTGDLAEFQKESSRANNADLKKLVSDDVRTIQHHLDSAKSLQTKV